MTALHFSSIHHSDLIDTIYNKYPDAINFPNSEELLGGSTPLITAVKWVKTDSVKKTAGTWC